MLTDRLTAYLRRPLVVEQRGRGLVVLILVMVWRKEPGRRGGILGLSLVFRFGEDNIVDCWAVSNEIRTGG